MHVCVWAFVWMQVFLEATSVGALMVVVPPAVGAGNQTWVLHKSDMSFL